MASLKVTPDVQVVTCGDSFLVRQNVGAEGEKGLVKMGRIPQQSESKENEEKGGGGGSNISCNAVCTKTNLLALCDESKRVTIWRLPEAELLSSRTLERKATRAIFTHDSKGLLIADKSGDVYLFNTEGEKEGQLLLGHLSMLLDLRISLDSKFVITADRDEKIRVSSFPNSYNIHNYCLGHGDFVTSLGILSDDLVLSGSGDGTVRVWRFLEGAEVARREVCNDVEQEVIGSEKLEVAAKAAAAAAEQEKNERRVAAPSQAAVVGVLCLRSSLFLVQVENFSGLLLYGLNFGMLEGKAGISLKQTISLSSSLLDYDFEPSSETLHILLKNDTSVVVETYKIDCSKLVKDSVHSFSDLKQADFFDAVKDFEKSNLENLHKRWFDNVKDYMEKKESRQEEMKRKEPPSAKKLKPEN